MNADARKRLEEMAGDHPDNDDSDGGAVRAALAEIARLTAERDALVRAQIAEVKAGGRTYYVVTGANRFHLYEQYDQAVAFVRGAAGLG